MAGESSNPDTSFSAESQPVNTTDLQSAPLRISQVSFALKTEFVALLRHNYSSFQSRHYECRYVFKIAHKYFD
jgi:hypothetical protein